MSICSYALTCIANGCSDHQFSLGDSNCGCAERRICAQDYHLQASPHRAILAITVRVGADNPVIAADLVVSCAG